MLVKVRVVFSLTHFIGISFRFLKYNLFHAEESIKEMIRQSQEEEKEASDVSKSRKKRMYRLDSKSGRYQDLLDARPGNLQNRRQRGRSESQMQPNNRRYVGVDGTRQSESRNMRARGGQEAEMQSRYRYDSRDPMAVERPVPKPVRLQPPPNQQARSRDDSRYDNVDRQRYDQSNRQGGYEAGPPGRPATLETDRNTRERQRQYYYSQYPEPVQQPARQPERQNERQRARQPPRQSSRPGEDQRNRARDNQRIPTPQGNSRYNQDNRRRPQELSLARPDSRNSRPAAFPSPGQTGREVDRVPYPNYYYTPPPPFPQPQPIQGIRLFMYSGNSP